jgi:hypothetical protein
MLVAFVGAILPAWGYHVSSPYLTVGNLFLSLNVGMLASIKRLRRCWGSGASRR